MSAAAVRTPRPSTGRPRRPPVLQGKTPHGAPKPVETPSALALRELREWAARHDRVCRSELGDGETRANIDEGLAAFVAHDTVAHVLSAIDVGRHLAPDEHAHVLFNPAGTADVNGCQVRRPPSLTFTFGRAYDVPQALPEIGNAPQRWRVLATANHDFYTECMRGSGVRGDDHDARDAAADAIIALGRWPNPSEVKLAMNQARAAAKAAKAGAS